MLRHREGADITRASGYRADLSTYTTYGVWDVPWDQAIAPKADRNRQKGAERLAAREAKLGPRGADVLEPLTWEQYQANEMHAKVDALEARINEEPDDGA